MKEDYQYYIAADAPDLYYDQSHDSNNWEGGGRGPILTSTFTYEGYKSFNMISSKDDVLDLKRLVEGIGKREDLRFLDVGCGTGYVVREMAKVCGVSEGIELQSFYVAEAARENPELCIHHGDAFGFDPHFYQRFNIIYLYSPIRDHRMYEALVEYIGLCVNPGTRIVQTYQKWKPPGFEIESRSPFTIVKQEETLTFVDVELTDTLLKAEFSDGVKLEVKRGLIWPLNYPEEKIMLSEAKDYITYSNPTYANQRQDSACWHTALELKNEILEAQHKADEASAKVLS